MARRIAEAVMPTRYGDFRGAGFQNGDSEAVALTREPLADDAPMVKLHSECVTGATLGSLRYDCGEQIDAALAIIARIGGVVLCLPQEGSTASPTRSGLTRFKTPASRCRCESRPRLPVDAREYRSAAAAVLRPMNLTRVRLITNNPKKWSELEAEGITVVERVRLEVRPNLVNVKYLETTAARMGHLILGRDKESAAG